MAKPKLTPWFPSSVKPVHVGAYQRSHSKEASDPDYWWWNGTFFVIGGWETADIAASNIQPIRTWDHYMYWRGLAEQPKEQKK